MNLKLVKHLSITIFLFAIGINNCLSQQYIAKCKSFETERWGLINQKGEYILEPVYRHIMPFTEDGYILVQEGAVMEYYAFLDSTGMISVKPDYKRIGKFVSGVAWVKTRDNYCGYINKYGDYLVKPQFNIAMDMEPVSGVAKVKHSVTMEWGYVDLKGNFLQMDKVNPLRSFSEGLCLGKIKNRCGFFDKNGNWIIEVKYEGARDFKNGYAAVKSEGNWGMINKQGEWMVQPIFDNLKDLEVITIDQTNYGTIIASSRETGDWGYINAKGEYILEPECYRVMPFQSNCYCRVIKKRAEEIAFINREGQIIIKHDFERVGEFKQGVAWVRLYSGLFGYINKHGEYLVKPQFEAAKNYDPVSGLARVRKNDTLVFTNMQGDIFYPPEGIAFSDFSEGLCRAKKNDKWGYLNNKMEWAIPPKYQGCRNFRYGYAIIKLNNKWGLIDSKGEIIVEPIFAKLKEFKVGL